MTRTGIFGGSFNPVHFGHVRLAQALVERKWVDEVWLMVSPQNPLKAQADLADEHVRLELARLAVADVSGVGASDFEFQLPRPSYTWRTLERLEEAFPDRSFTLIMGADNWRIFPQWRRSEDILFRYSIIVYPRGGSAVDELALPPNVRLFHAPLFPWSSTVIRSRIRQGESISGMVPPGVAKAIAQKRLYGYCRKEV